MFCIEIVLAHYNVETVIFKKVTRFEKVGFFVIPSFSTEFRIINLKISICLITLFNIFYRIFVIDCFIKLALEMFKNTNLMISPIIDTEQFIYRMG